MKKQKRNRRSAKAEATAPELTNELARRSAALHVRARRMEAVAVIQADERTVLKELRAPGSVKGALGERIREYFSTGKIAERVGVAS